MEVNTFTLSLKRSFPFSMASWAQFLMLLDPLMRHEPRSSHDGRAGRELACGRRWSE